jgi:hypothetical protein
LSYANPHTKAAISTIEQLGGRSWNTVPLDATTQQSAEHNNRLGFAATT